MAFPGLASWARKMSSLRTREKSHRHLLPRRAALAAEELPEVGGVGGWFHLIADGDGWSDDADGRACMVFEFDYGELERQLLLEGLGGGVEACH